MNTPPKTKYTHPRNSSRLLISLNVYDVDSGFEKKAETFIPTVFGQLLIIGILGNFLVNCHKESLYLGIPNHCPDH